MQLIEDINAELDRLQWIYTLARKEEPWMIALYSDEANRCVMLSRTSPLATDMSLMGRSQDWLIFLQQLPTGIAIQDVGDIIQEYNSKHPPR